MSRFIKLNKMLKKPKIIDDSHDGFYDVYYKSKKCNIFIALSFVNL